MRAVCDKRQRKKRRMARYNTVNGKKKTVKNVLIGALCAILLAGSVSGVVALVKVTENKQVDLAVSAYTIGQLSDTTGKAESGVDGGLFTETYYNAETSEVKIKESATVTVYANLYDKDKKFLTVVPILSDTKISALAADTVGAKYVRFEIIPEEDADGKISTSEKLEYSLQVTITVDK